MPQGKNSSDTPLKVVFVYKGRYLVQKALELETLAAVVRGLGHRPVLAYDPDVFGVTDNVFHAGPVNRMISRPEILAKKILAEKPDLILYQTLPSTAATLARVRRMVAEKSTAPSFFMGLFPSLSPEAVLKESGANGVVLGEAENALPALLSAVRTGRGLDEVPGLARMENGKVRKNPLPPLADLDALPLPEKDLFHPFVDHARSYPAMVSRGCPFACSYCEETCMKGLYGPRYFRRKSVDRIMEELTRARERYAFKEVIFKDSYLNGDADWLARLMERYEKQIRVPFKCFCTISGFDRETARALKSGGCYNIEFGLQTVNEGLRKELLNRKETNEDARAAFWACAAEKLFFDVDHMFNLPGESAADHEAGALFYRSLPYLNRVKVHYLVVLPGAPILEQAAKVLPQARLESLAEGRAGDFYDQEFGDPETRTLVAGYAALYKLLPGLPRATVARLARPENARALARIPAPVLAGLQGALAVKGRDLRFLVYARDYPRKAALAVRESLAWRGGRG